MKHLLTMLCLLLALSALMAEQVVVSEYQNDIRLTQSSPNYMEMEFTLGSFNREAVTINGSQWYNLNLKKEGLTLEAGYPQVPVLARSVIIPGTAAMLLNTIGSQYIDLPMQVAPSKGNLTRNINPDTVPYSFAGFYSGNSSYPAQQAYLTEPFIIRDYRGITVRFQPFEYFPATGTLRVYTKLQLAIQVNGTDFTNAMATPKTSYSSYFEDFYQNMFLNFGDAKYPSLGEEGRILVIKNSMFDAAIQPWVDWKRQIGFTVDVVDVTVAGPSANQILAYIQAQYNLNDGLMFVQIVGDAPQVPTLSSGGGGSDPSYALLAGGDSYPDIYVGRFSAQTVAELNTQVQRTITYERDLTTDATWLQKAFGIASNEGGGSQGDMGESDQVHMENIRTDLLGYGYTTIEQIYQGTGGNATQISTAVNQGRGFGNYVGHGSDTSWASVTYTNTNVNALTNSNMLPFIVSVACVNGNFVSQTCFAEAWLRATNNSTGEPTGAIAFYGSTINQGWNPPMRGQDEVTDLLIVGAKHRIGSLYYNGSSKMIEVYGTSGISEYKCWTIFGDASLMVRTKTPEALTAVYNPILFMGVSSFARSEER
ncbi:MAG: C25 family cysteine peptidase, partial [Candidatus Cloacimonas sp.]|nr:C25 family cysteine peptidase [Candidatus Cloacimonas sp.]